MPAFFFNWNLLEFHLLLLERHYDKKDFCAASEISEIHEREHGRERLDQ